MAGLNVYPPNKNGIQGENYYAIYYSGGNKDTFKTGIEFAEFSIQRNKEKYVVFGQLGFRKPIPATVSSGDKKGEVLNNNIPVVFQIRHTEGMKYGKDKDGNKTEELEKPSKLDLQVCGSIEKQELWKEGETKFWKGTMFYDDSDDYNIGLSGFADIVLIESPQLMPPMPDATVVKTNNYSGGSNKKSVQAESEKLQERIDCLLSQIEGEYKTMFELFHDLNNGMSPEKQKVINQLLDYFPRLLSKD